MPQYKEYKSGNTRIAYDPFSGEGIAFATPEERAKYFTTDITQDVGDLPVDPAPYLTAPNAPAKGERDMALIADLAGRAGLTPEQFIATFTEGVSEEERGKVRDSYGIPALEEQAFAPAPSTEQLFNDAFAASGLVDIKTRRAQIAAETKKKKDELNQRMLGVNENPWLSEASRLTNVANTKNFFQGDLSNLFEEDLALNDLYTTGLNEINSLVSRKSTDFANTQGMTRDQLEYLTAKAEQEIARREREASGKVARYVPDFLESRSRSTKPETITTSDGAIYQWDRNTSRFVEIRGPTTDYKVNPETGELYDPRTGRTLEEGGGAFSGSTTNPATGQQWRTDRHNNPTAFTTDIARQAGLVEGRDYVVGDAFPGNPNLRTAKLLGDPIQTTIQVIDSIGFYTQDGRQRWSHTAMSPQQWRALSPEQRASVVAEMYRNEGGSGSLVGGTTGSKPLTKSQKQTVNDITDDVRQDPDIKDFVVARDGYERVKAGEQLNSPQGDIAIVFGYMKLLDPSSVVREGEFATAENTAGLDGKIRVLYNKLLNGERLTAQQRAEFTRGANSLYQTKERNYRRAYGQYENRAKQSGIDPNLVLRDYTAAGDEPQSVQDVVREARHNGQTDSSIIKDLMATGRSFQEAAAIVSGTK